MDFDEPMIKIICNFLLDERKAEGDELKKELISNCSIA